MITLRNKFRGMTILADEPDVRYRRYHELYLDGGEFTTEAYQNGEFLGKPHWVVGFTRPDGSRQATYSGVWTTREEAEHARTTYAGATTARLRISLRVWLDADGNLCGYAGNGGGIGEYAPLEFGRIDDDPDLPAIYAERTALDAAWLQAQEASLAYEDETQRLVANAAALDGIGSGILHKLHGPTECLECGAVYDEPGHVDEGAMGCKRCN